MKYSPCPDLAHVHSPLVAWRSGFSESHWLNMTEAEEVVHSGKIRMMLWEEEEIPAMWETGKEMGNYEAFRVLKITEGSEETEGWEMDSTGISKNKPQNESTHS